MYMAMLGARDKRILPEWADKNQGMARHRQMPNQIPRKLSRDICLTKSRVMNGTRLPNRNMVLISSQLAMASLARPPPYAVSHGYSRLKFIMGDSLLLGCILITSWLKVKALDATVRKIRKSLIISAASGHWNLVMVKYKPYLSWRLSWLILLKMRILPRMSS